LTNAVYFKGKWDSPFEKEATQQKDFTTAANSKVQCQMMNKQEDFSYAETADYQAIELPYKNSDLSMIAILPKTGKMSVMEQKLSGEQFTQIKNSMSSQLVDVYLPKFKFDTSYDMNNTLSAMGMPTAFDLANADFSGMDGTRNLYIGVVIHKAYVDVNEEGTEAAAATGVAGSLSMATPMERPQPKIFNADHPFIFAIVHNATGSILFMGKVNDPTK
jgi:serpin B